MNNLIGNIVDFINDPIFNPYANFIELRLPLLYLIKPIKLLRLFKLINLTIPKFIFQILDLSILVYVFNNFLPLESIVILPLQFLPLLFFNLTLNKFLYK